MSAASLAYTPEVFPTEERGRQSIFIWLDILGFSEAVEDEFEYEMLAELLGKFQSLFNEGEGYETTIISDGIILQITNPVYESFVKSLKDIGEKQFRFINEQGHFIRGGISTGTKLENNKASKKGGNHQFVSNGLARAVKIEERHVSWPIVGTNATILSEIKKLMLIRDEEELFGLTKGFNANGSELFFIDFLNELDDEKKEHEKYYQLLNKKVKEFRDNSRILNKYLWLLRYFHHRFAFYEVDEALNGTVL